MAGALNDSRLSFATAAYGLTRKGTLLESVPWGVATWTLPVVAPVGTVAVMKDLETR